MKVLMASVVWGVALAVTTAWAQFIRTEPSRFAKGESDATIKGQIRGDQIVDDTLSASAGQSTVIILTPTNRSAYLNLTAPGRGYGVVRRLDFRHPVRGGTFPRTALTRPACA